MTNALRITQHLAEAARFLESPHADERPDDGVIDMVVVHGISLPAGHFGLHHITDLFLGRLDVSADPSFEAIQHLKVSAHCLIRRTGELIQYVPFNKRAWHAGLSAWQGREKCNDFSIGIELEGTDTTPYTQAQYATLSALIKGLQQSYPAISDARVVGHEHIAPGRKTDPGPAFDWQRLARDCDLQLHGLVLKRD